MTKTFSFNNLIVEILNQVDMQSQEGEDGEDEPDMFNVDEADNILEQLVWGCGVQFKVQSIILNSSLNSGMLNSSPELLISFL